jgi:hypothetical protein
MYFFLRNVALSEDAWYTQGNKNHSKNLLLSRRSAEQRRPVYLSTGVMHLTDQF